MAPKRTSRDASEPVDQIQEKTYDNVLPSDMTLTLDAEGSPTLRETFTELSSKLKSVISRVKDLKLDDSSTHEGVEHKNPRSERFAKISDSLVKECLDFLNNASMEELKNLEWIGEKKANNILKLREESSAPFKNIDDLKGLGLSVNQIKAMISQLIDDITNNYIDAQ